MIFPLIILYSISDFLLDQKASLTKLDKLFKKAKSEDRRTEIREQQEYIFNQGLQALRRHECELPNCIRQYFLGNKPKPETDQIVQESHEICEMHRKINRTISLAAFLITVLFLLAILF